MSNDIKKLLDEKQKIYNKILDLLEHSVLKGGGTIDFTDKVNIIDPVEESTYFNPNQALLNKLNLIESGGKMSLSEAMINSFNRIKKNRKL